MNRCRDKHFDGIKKMKIKRVIMGIIFPDTFILLGLKGKKR
jgi:hypothetical protein